jgi:hypothetical protein
MLQQKYAIPHIMDPVATDLNSEPHLLQYMHPREKKIWVRAIPQKYFF